MQVEATWKSTGRHDSCICMTLFRFLAKPALSTVKLVPFRQELLPKSIKRNERHERSLLFEGFSYKDRPHFVSASSFSFCFVF